MTSTQFSIENSIPGYEIIEEITTGGSERKFYRCVKNKKNYIILKDKIIEDHLKLQKHLYGRGIGVPEIHEIHADYLIIEDLGKDSLYEIARKKNKNIKILYEKAIAELIKLQIDGFSMAPVNLYYDYEHIKWEQDYFKEFFLNQFCKIPINDLKTLDKDFEKLARKLIEESKPISNFLMHRDYQSQNIYIKDDRARIIDFQSARIGPLTYDLASLLKDAYVKIPRSSEKMLIDYYLRQLKKREIEVDKAKFLKIYHLTGLQRNMQALGAFANLSLNKKKPYFKKFIPRGLALLKSGLEKTEFKELFGDSIFKQLNNRSIITLLK